MDTEPKTTVVNLRHSDFDVYIGRGSKWGNRWSHIPGTKALYLVDTREEAIKCYEEWILTQPELLAAIKTELRGRRISCYCAPLPCHGDVLARLADEPDDIDTITDPTQDTTE